MDFQNIKKTPKILDFRGLLFFCDIRLNYRLHNLLDIQHFLHRTKTAPAFFLYTAAVHFVEYAVKFHEFC